MKSEIMLVLKVLFRAGSFAPVWLVIIVLFYVKMILNKLQEIQFVVQ